MSFTDEFAEKLSTARTTVLELRDFSDPILHTSCADVSLEEGLEVGMKLEEALKSYRKVTGVGRGLAAPQIGISRRVFITYVNDKAQIFINPKITKTSDTKSRYRELCMSAEGMWGDIERPAIIELSWMDEQGVSQTGSFETFMARLLQHEYDHLEGVVCLDKALPGTIEPVSSSPLDEQLRSV